MIARMAAEIEERKNHLKGVFFLTTFQMTTAKGLDGPWFQLNQKKGMLNLCFVDSSSFGED